MAHLHFSEQADGEHVQARQQQDGGEHHQRAVLGHHIGLVQELLQNEPARPADDVLRRPKKCKGRERYLSRKRMVMRSKKTRKVREIP